MLNALTRLPLALVGLAIALLVDFVATAGHRRLFGVELGRELDEQERLFRRHGRALYGLLTVGTLALIGFHPWPGGAFAALLGFAVASPFYLQAAQHRARLRFASDDVPGPRTVYAAGAVGFWDIISAPLHTLNLGLLATASLFFRWLLPVLPSVAQIHAGYASYDGFGEPRRLWATLALVGFNTSVMVFVAWAVTRERWASEMTRDETSKLIVQRRALLVRTIEVIMVGFNLAALIVWIAAALALVPGQRVGVASRGATIGVAVAGVFFVYALARYLPPLSRIRARLTKLGARPVADPAGYRFFGVFYYAPDDPAVFVPKKAGVGSTLNLARPSAWVFLAVLIVGPIAFAYATTR